MVDLEKYPPRPEDSSAAINARLSDFRDALTLHDQLDPDTLDRQELTAAFLGVREIARLALDASSQLASALDYEHAKALFESQRADEIAGERDAMKRAINERERGIDSLTFAGNRSAFEIELAEAVGKEPSLFLIAADLDNLHGINESYGYASGGDGLLREVAEKLRDEEVSATGQLQWRGMDVFRYGGDEFFVICRHVMPRSHDLLLADLLYEEHVRIEDILEREVVTKAGQLALKADTERPYVGATVAIEAKRPEDTSTSFKERALAKLRHAKADKKRLLRRSDVTYDRNDY